MTTYLNGCNRAVVEADHCDKDGNMIDSKWLDVVQLGVLEKGKVPMGPSRETGGPRDHDVPAGLIR